LAPSARRACVTELLLPTDLLDVHGSERDDAHRRDEARRARPVHVPHPRVAHVELEVGAVVLGAQVHVDRVGEIEAALCLHDVGEHLDDVAVLLVELELDLGLVPLEVLGAHGCTTLVLMELRSSASLWCSLWCTTLRCSLIVPLYVSEERCSLDRPHPHDGPAHDRRAADRAEDPAV